MTLSDNICSVYSSQTLNNNPVYNYLLPIGANCASLPSNISCRYGSICNAYNICSVDNSSSVKPKYPPNLGMFIF